MAKKPKAYKRSKRKDQIILQMQIWQETGFAREVTLNKIAKALKLEPTQHLRSILLEMVSSGDLTSHERDQSGRWTTRFYALSDARVLSRVVLKRRVNVKRKGVVSAQLEMWS